MASSCAYFDNKAFPGLEKGRNLATQVLIEIHTYTYTNTTNTNMNDDTKYKVKRKLTAGSHSNIRSSVVWDTAIIGT